MKIQLFKIAKLSIKRIHTKPMHVAYQIKGRYKTNAMVPFLCQIFSSAT